MAVTMQGDAVQAWPVERVAYLPVAPRLPEPPDAPFAAGENLEFRQGDFKRAAAIYRELSHSRDAAVRAGALLRLARSLRSGGRPSEAIPVYEELLSEDGLAFDGVPASLVARQARCSLMEALNRTSGLREEAKALGADLQRGRWTLTRPVVQLYEQDLARLGFTRAPCQSEREILAQAVGELWRKLPATGPPASARESMAVGQNRLVVIWSRSATRVSALLASQKFVETQWLQAVAPVLQEQRVELTLHGAPGSSPAGTIRRADDTGLPWTVMVASRSPAAERGQFELRRRLLVAGFAVLLMLALLASYMIFRAVSREFALARLQSDFVAAVSHEFRTPLTSLRQFTDMLREHNNLSEERRNLCYEAQARATDRLTRLVESLLDFGRMEGGARLYHLQPHDCAELVRGVVEEFRAETQSADFQLRIAEDGVAEIDADGEALRRALWNLLDNAAKYSGAAREIYVAVQRRDAEVAISVRDLGLGIPADEQPLVFRKFHRGEEARNLGIKGTGIGLAMVDHIVKAHHGRVELSSEPGRGSTFTVVLPVRR